MVMLYVAGQKVGTIADTEKLLQEYSAKGVEIEYRDDAGKLLGRMVPPEPLCPWDPSITREELDRRSARGGMPLAEFWKKMGVE